MLIVVDNLKGGQGKSTLSVALALETGAGIITNDLYSPIDKALPKRCIKMDRKDALDDLEEKKRTRKIILDFGGYADPRMVDAIKLADVVVIPTINAFADVQVSIRTIQEVARYNRKILVVANRAKPGDLEEVRAAIHGTVGKYPVLPLKSSKALAGLYLDPKPISQLVAEGGLNAHVYQELNQQIRTILKAIQTIAAS
jgi:MinD-like ATPase involved in chromosome partitioning or flagellar assembly